MASSSREWGDVILSKSMGFVATLSAIRRAVDASKAIGLFNFFPLVFGKVTNGGCGYKRLPLC